MMADTVNDITDRFNRAVDDVTRAKLHAEQEVRDRTRELIRNEQLASVGFLGGWRCARDQQPARSDRVDRGGTWRATSKTCSEGGR